MLKVSKEVDFLSILGHAGLRIAQKFPESMNG